jgi:hypothetical protein
MGLGHAAEDSLDLTKQIITAEQVLRQHDCANSVDCSAPAQTTADPRDDMEWAQPHSELLSDIKKDLTIGMMRLTPAGDPYAMSVDQKAEFAVDGIFTDLVTIRAMACAAGCKVIDDGPALDGHIWEDFESPLVQVYAIRHSA